MFCFSKYAVSLGLFSSKTSRLIIHDWERAEYKAMVTELGYRLEREDTKPRRHLASLQPPSTYSATN